MGQYYSSDSDIMESLESIYYQLDSPLKEFLISSVNRCKEAYSTHASDVDRIADITDVFIEVSESIKHRTGINLYFHIMPLPLVGLRYNVNVSIPKNNVASVVSTKLTDRTLGQLTSGKYEHLEIIKGSMDLEQLKVTGFYTSIAFDFNIDVDFFKPDFMTAEEITAIIFHEMGHAWDYMYGLGESARTGAIAGATFDVLRGDATIEKKLSLVKVLSPELSKDIEDPGSLSDEEIIALVQANSFIRRSTASGTSDYNRYMTEFKADQFASRHGMAHNLATAQRKLEHKKSVWTRHSKYQPYWFGGSMLMLDMFTIATLPYSFFKSVGKVTLKKIAMSLARDFLFSWIMSIIPKGPGSITIHPTIRLDLIRTDLVSLLKDKSIDDRTKAAIIRDIDMLDKEIGDLKITLRSPFSIIIDHIMIMDDLSYRTFKTSTNVNSLTNNRLYELAERLRVGNE